MKIKNQLILGICGTFIALFLVSQAALSFSLLGTLEKMEVEKGLAELQNYYQILDNQREALLVPNRDWAQWDQTYFFVLGNNPQYEETELMQSTFDILKIDLFLILDREGNLFFIKGSSNDPTWVSNELTPKIIQSRQFISEDELWTKSGYVSLLGKVVLLSANPILNSYSEGPIAGTLVFGQLFDEEKLGGLKPPSKIIVGLEFQPEQAVKIPVSEGYGISLTNPDQLLGVAVIPSIPSFEGVAIEVTFTRSIYQEGVKLLNAFLVVFMGFLLFSALGVIIIADKTLLDRVNEIGSKVEELDPAKPLNQLTFKEKNELNRIVNGINRLLNEIETYKERLKESERLAAMGQTASMVGHDLRNPLQVITSTSYLIKKKLVRNKENLTSKDFNDMTQLLTSVDEQITYMDKIVSDIQAYSQKIKPKKSEANILSLAKDTLSTVKVPNEIQVILDEKKLDVPLVRVDPQLIKRVFINLILNAIQAMPNGGTLTVSMKRNGDIAEVTVQDTGIGISDESHANLFKPFYTTKAKGTGLGLAVCKKIIEAHGGSISVQSRKGEGTTIVFTLPISEFDEHPD